MDDLLTSHADSAAALLEGPDVSPVNGERPAWATAMIVFEDVRKVYEPDVVAFAAGVLRDREGRVRIRRRPRPGRASRRSSGSSSRSSSPRAGASWSAVAISTRLKRSKVPLLRRNVGCVFQDFKLLRGPLRIRERGVRAPRPGRVVRRRSAARCPRCCALVGLAHKSGSRPDELSGGEQQRVSIARAVVNHPPLLICDEPTGDLSEPDTSVGIMQLLHRINTAGTTILMVTHDREMVDKMRKRVIALEQRQGRPRRTPRGLRDRVTLQAIHSTLLARDERRHSSSLVAPIPSGIGAPCVLASLAPCIRGTWPHHPKGHR